jgi:hypothetical protein
LKDQSDNLTKAVEPPILENKEFEKQAKANLHDDQVSGTVKTGEMPSVAGFTSVKNWEWRYGLHDGPNLR